MKISGPSLSEVDRESDLYRKLREVHARIAKKDSQTWGSKAAAEAAVRLNWVDLPESSQSLLPQISDIAKKFSTHTRVVLCGMGGSSLGPEVIALTYKREIFIFDSTDPNYAEHAISNDLAKTVVVVSSKSGSTIETSSQRSLFQAQFEGAGLNPVDHMLFVTDPGSPLDIEVRASGYSVINADPNVGGRFSVLSAFGLVPSALAGAPVAELLADASAEKSSFLKRDEVILDVTYLLVTQAEQYIAFTDAASSVPGLSDWIEQLIAESTGKDATGRLPIATEDTARARVGGSFTVAYAGTGADLTVEGSLGAHFIFWEWVTALMGAALKIDPFNQPNVTEAKEQTVACLTEWNNSVPTLTPACTEKSVEIFGDGQSLKDALATFIEDVKDGGYIAIMAYLDRRDDVKIAELRSILAEKSGHPTSFGWGPRFLHSTGQFHKGGQKNGSFLQITGETSIDYAIPGRSYSLRTLLFAQAIGDNRALATRKYPLLRLHLQNRSAGIDEILAAARSL
ncbi:Phosphoglucose isomerase (PGI) [Candidatus Nanopelagicaceae bacterium]